LPQSSNIHTQYENISLPAVGATFETTIFHRQKLQDNSAIEPSKINFDIDIYLNENAKDEQPQKSQSAINFSVCKLKDNQSTCELAKYNDKPAVKRRKINILPLGVDSYFSNSSSSSSAISESNPIQKEVNQDDKKTLGKQYLKDVSKMKDKYNYLTIYIRLNYNKLHNICR